MAPGVLRSQLPIDLPGLGHVNCYIMEDERGVAVVDPGLPGETAWSSLTDRLDRAGYKVADVHTVIVTHSHPDHFGGAMALRQSSGADIVTHDTFRLAWNDAELNSNEDSASLDANAEEQQDTEIERYYSRKLPWGSPRSRPSESDVARFKRIGRFSQATFATPEPSVRVVDGQTIRLARRDWFAIHTPGHTHDHLCLFDPEQGVLFTGDHVLPTITPHIGGLTPEGDPLAQFFGSLERMTEIADVSVALPAHGHPFVDVGARALAIVDHHHDRLDIIRRATAQVPAGTVTDFMRILFRERSWGDMAESETYAHLEHLRLRGELQRADPDGVAHYTPVHPVT